MTLPFGADGDAGQHTLDQVVRRVMHPAGPAARTQAALLARERQRPLGGAVRTPKPDDPFSLEPKAKSAIFLGRVLPEGREPTSKPCSGSPQVRSRVTAFCTNAGTELPVPSMDSTYVGHHSRSSGWRTPWEGSRGT